MRTTTCVLIVTYSTVSDSARRAGHRCFGIRPKLSDHDQSTLGYRDCLEPGIGQLNAALHRIALTEARCHPDAARYFNDAGKVATVEWKSFAS